MNTKYMTNGALLVGPVVPINNVVTGELLGCMPENRERLLALAKVYRLRRHEDGWFVDGRAHRSQIWEFGAGKLGLTVAGGQFIRKCRDESRWLRSKSIGDQEANFYCDWTDENLAMLTELVGLQKRRPSIAPVGRRANSGIAGSEDARSEPKVADRPVSTHLALCRTPATLPT